MVAASRSIEKSALVKRPPDLAPDTAWLTTKRPASRSTSIQRRPIDAHQIGDRRLRGHLPPLLTCLRFGRERRSVMRMWTMVMVGLLAVAGTTTAYEAVAGFKHTTNVSVDNASRTAS